MTHHQQNAGSLVGGPAQDPVQEFHRVRGVGEGRQPGLVQGIDEKAGGDAHGFRHVVVLALVALRVEAVALRENRYQPGSGLKEGFAGIRAHLLQVAQPLLPAFAGVEFLLLLLRGESNLAFDGQLADTGKMPGLVIGAARGRSRRAQAGLNDSPVHRFVGKVAHRVALPDEVVVRPGARQGLLRAKALAVRQGYGVVVVIHDRVRHSGWGAIRRGWRHIWPASAGCYPALILLHLACALTPSIATIIFTRKHGHSSIPAIPRKHSSSKTALFSGFLLPARGPAVTRSGTKTTKTGKAG